MSVILNTSHKHSLLIMTFAQYQCQSLVPTISVFLVYCTFLYHYIRLHEQPIKYRKSHVDWRSIYINLWKRFFPFVSGAAMFHVPEEYRFTFLGALILTPTQTDIPNYLGKKFKTIQKSSVVSFFALTARTISAMAKFSLATFLDSYENGHRVKKRSEKIIETPHFSLVNYFLFPLKPS